ncbi:SDR family oxidoreductase [Inquilinus sp. Marseille-Q2685]|uniref:SDR family oxidoreductase n=1 Tax=Inquilinus sp. Marseille-Q2685 TaxID=2866581 RepID=UPI001CE46316|nr:SDR family oxidoreductase [Inquilinus sp. Marseille-Q2685]
MSPAERPLPPTGRAMPRVAVVTGAAKRIGRAIAIDLASHGWRVAITYHSSAEEAAQTVRDIEAAGAQGVAIQADLTDEAQVETVIPKAAAALGSVSLLVNNASAFRMDTVATATRASWDEHLETNLRAPLVLTLALARQLPADWPGNVVNMLDQRVWNPTPYFLSYTVAKIGLWTLTRTLAQALAPQIRVNGIGPGPTLKSDRQSEEHFARQWDAVPLRRPTAPQEICDAIRFILSAPAMTGQMIALDGGEHLGWAQPSRGIVPME